MERYNYFLLGALLCFSWCFCASSQQLSQNITHPSEVRALEAIYGGLEDPFRKLRNWTESSDPCTSNWTGVICRSDKNDGYLHVVELRLLNKNLSGILDPQLGQLTNLTILNFMWNGISGSIPKEIGKLTSLTLLLLTGNRLTGNLPEELGDLSELRRLQVDLNNISGSLPKSLANLSKVLHFHMNNNSISGQIPVEFSALPALVHFLLDNNNLSGTLPPEISQMPKLRIIQLDNNNFAGSEIPVLYANMSTLLKLSLRNCNLRGSIPDFSTVPKLLYLDLSYNSLSGSIPTNKLSNRITTIDLSNNQLGGPIPSNFSGLPDLQKLILEGNSLTGNVPSTLWQNVTFTGENRLILNFKNNLLSNLSSDLNPPQNVTIQLKGNSVCDRARALNITELCEIEDVEPEKAPPKNSSQSGAECPRLGCPTAGFFEYVEGAPEPCSCAAPIVVWILLRSPSMQEFRAYVAQFQEYIATHFGYSLYQLVVESFTWQEGPRVSVEVKLFPAITGNDSQVFNTSEIQRLRDEFSMLSIPLNDTFGPYDLINFILQGPYQDVVLEPLEKSSISKGLIAGIVIGSVAGGIVLVIIIACIVRKTYPKHVQNPSGAPRNPNLVAEAVKGFSFAELEVATDRFNDQLEIGKGGYGRVYRGLLANGKAVAVKRARRVSLQTSTEFFMEIQVLSRVHHRNLVSLVGYCDEESEQLLVYEFMPKGSLGSLLSARFGCSLSFGMRLSIALDAARGVLYLHTEAHPPILHLDIKANNILLDSNFNAKVSDFGICKIGQLPDGGDTPTLTGGLRGTPGYMDPEYCQTREPKEKSDVYSLGIVFLELLTGLPPIFNGSHIVNEVVDAYESRRNLSTIIDRNMGTYDSDSVKRFFDLALRCSHDHSSERPLMLEIVRELENISSTLPPQNNNNNNTTGSSSSTGIYSGNNAFERNLELSAYDLHHGSNLVSGVIPTIKPR